MKRILAIAAAVLALPLLNACSSPSRAGEADDLRSALAKLPGVAKAELDYTKPVTLDSGKLELRVAMTADAAPEDAVRVAKRAYVGFAGPHHGEEGDVFITMGDDTIHLRSFDPDAEVAAVEKAAEHAIAVLPSGAVRADITTQDIDASPHVFTEYTVTISEKGGDSVLRALKDLEKAHGDNPHAAWRVQTREDAAGWELGSTSAFPSAQQRALFDDLRRGLPRGASILLVDGLVTAQVPAEATPDEVSAMAGRHLERLGGVKKAFYVVSSGDDSHLMNSEGDCTFASGPVGDRLKKDHGTACTEVEVTKP